MTETTTRPTRKRATPAAKAAPAKAAPAPTADSASEAEADTTATKVVMQHVSTSKRFEKFIVPPELEAAGYVGQLYAPVGTTEVRVLFIK